MAIVFSFTFFGQNWLLPPTKTYRRLKFAMKKRTYRFYKNKRTKYHPSLEIESNKEKWKNMELTSSPTHSGRYIKLRHNPSGNKKDAFIRKYVRNDSIKTRGQLLAKYHLSEEDLKEIEEFLINNKKS